jgi:hypothetical protein
MSKKRLLALAFLLIILFSIQTGAEASIGHCLQITAENTAMVVMRDVIGLDLSYYNATLVSYVSKQPDRFDGLIEEDLSYSLSSSSGKSVQVVVMLVNSTLSHYLLYNYDLEGGTPPINFPKEIPCGIMAQTEFMLKKYQNYSEAPYIQPILEMLNTSSIDENTPMTILSNNLKMELATTITDRVVSWTFCANDADYPQQVAFTFRCGKLVMFTDSWYLHRVGSTELSVTREEAINQAWQLANNSDLTTVKMGFINVKVNLLSDPDSVILYAADRGDLTAFPIWSIHFMANASFYPIDGVQVELWADNGQVASIQTTGREETTQTRTTTQPAEITSIEPSTPPPSFPIASNLEDQSNLGSSTSVTQKLQPGFLGTSLPLEYGYAIVAVLVIIVVAGLSLAYSKRYRK